MDQGLIRKRLLPAMAFACLGAGMIGFDPPRPYVFPELKHFPVMPLAHDNQVTVEGAELGRHLFYDPILSLDSTMSCASCHRQEVAFSDAPNRFSEGLGGERLARNTMPLFNLAWYSSMFWDGRIGSLEDQVFHPVRAHDEMNLSWPEAEERVNRNAFYRQMFKLAFGEVEIDSILIARAVAQFERTLISINSKYDRVLRGEDHFTSDEYEGFVLMNDQTKGDCLHCHTTDSDALGTTGLLSNNGLFAARSPSDYADPGHGGVTFRSYDYGFFRIPSLRNVTLTAPYMHDGRFNTLEDVLKFYSAGVHAAYNIDPKMGHGNQRGAQLTIVEQEQVIAFLKTLTDSSFITNRAFSDPLQ